VLCHLQIYKPYKFLHFLRASSAKLGINAHFQIKWFLLLIFNSKKYSAIFTTIKKLDILSNWESNYNGWFKKRGWEAHGFQKESANKYFKGYSGLLNAPTGSGKTYALAIPAIVDYVQKNKPKGLFLLWITPLKALSVDIRAAIETAADELNAGWYVALRNGDTEPKERTKQKKEKPQCLVTTPESLHILLAQKDATEFFQNLNCVVIDEWHELMGSKRGVQVELGLSRLRNLCKNIKIWGISATIGNLAEARDVLIPNANKICIVKSDIEKRIKIHTIMPDNLEELPWSGHLGVKLLHKILPVIEQSKTTLIFTNTRAQSEIWYQNLLNANPKLAGRMAIHHGSLTSEVRNWVEKMLHAGELKAVVCTSSLDLGVDFRPVDSVIQIGSPKGVARFVQRAGRSGHRPGEISKIWFLPTNSLELLEAAALKTAIANKQVESRIPVVRAFDVLVQYLMTLAVGEGFKPEEIFWEIKNTHAFHTITDDEYKYLLYFLTEGGKSLSSYDEYKRVVNDNGIYRVTDRRTAMHHRLSIGTIQSDTSILIKFMHGSRIGTIEEYFITRLNIGDCFVFAGKVLELVKTDGTTAYVRKANKPKGAVPSWQGGRMSLSSELAKLLRQKISNWNTLEDEELKVLKPLFLLQQERSKVPEENELLIEYHVTDEGYHLFVFPFEGRMVNEGLAMLIAYRLSKIKTATFSIGMNDYGFELLSDSPILLEEALEEDVFSPANLISDLFSTTNYSEITRKRFSEIANISGLVFKGTPNKPIKNRHLQANASLFYQVFKDYEPENLLLKQAEEEALYYQLDEHRLREALQKINSQHIIITRPTEPTPFSFPILVDRLREKLSNETLEDRVKRLMQEYVK